MNARPIAIRTPYIRAWNPVLAASTNTTASSVTRLSARTPSQIACDANLQPGNVNSRPVLFGAIDLGPNHGPCGCGSEGSTGVPDKLLGIDLTNACYNHDEGSDPLFEYSSKPLSDVIQTQVDFAKNIYAAGGDSFWGKVKATAIASVYVPAVSIAAGLQYVGNRAVDVVSAIGSGIASAVSALLG